MLSKRFLHYLSSGLIGGLLLILIEAIDRSIILGEFFSSASDRVLFICGLSFISMGNMLLGALIALVCALSAWTLALMRARLPQTGTISGWITRPASTLAAAAPPILFFTLIPSSAYAFNQFLEGIRDRVSKLSFAADHPMLLLCLSIYAVAVVLVLLDADRFEKLCRRKWFAVLIVILFGLAAVGFYRLDSSFFVGRYRYFFHIPAALGAIGSSFIFGMALSHCIKRQRILIALLGVPIVIAFAIALFGFENDRSAKALFLRRGVIAKKYVFAAQHFIDLDRDGFSAFLDGGDCDDLNAALNPLARENPDDGIDDNCILGEPEPPADFSYLNQNPLPERLASNVLFITIDCLRADHLGCYGYTRNTSPNIDRFAAQSIIFEHAFTLGTNTGHAFAGIAVSNYGEAIFDEQTPTVVELMAEGDRDTAAITGPKLKKWLKKRHWDSYKKIMLKGFQTRANEAGKAWNAKRLTDETINYIQNRQGKPFYAWVHYNDLHAKGEWHYIKRSERGFGDRPIDRYDSNAAYVDEHLGRLFSYLESSGLLESTIVAISADHGEEFLDHGQLYHSGRPYPEQARVPLILWHPGVKPLRVKEPVSLIDLAPTFLRGVGLLPPREYKGIGLRQAAAGLAKGRKVFIETPRNVPQGNSFAWGIVDGDWLFIYDLFGNTYELYDKAADPTCRTNLIDTETVRAKAMMSALGGWLDAQSQRKDYRRWERF